MHTPGKLAQLKVWEAIIPAPLYGTPIRIEGVYHTQEAAAHSLLLRIARFEALLAPFDTGEHLEGQLPLPPSLTWIMPCNLETRTRFWASVKNAVAHRRKVRDGLVLISVLRWQEEHGLSLLHPGIAEHVAENTFANNMLGMALEDVTPAAADPAPAPPKASQQLALLDHSSDDDSDACVFVPPLISQSDSEGSQDTTAGARGSSEGSASSVVQTQTAEEAMLQAAQATVLAKLAAPSATLPSHYGSALPADSSRVGDSDSDGL